MPRPPSSPPPGWTAWILLPDAGYDSNAADASSDVSLHLFLPIERSVERGSEQGLVCCLWSGFVDVSFTCVRVCYVGPV